MYLRMYSSNLASQRTNAQLDLNFRRPFNLLMKNTIDTKIQNRFKILSTYYPILLRAIRKAISTQFCGISGL